MLYYPKPNKPPRELTPAELKEAIKIFYDPWLRRFFDEGPMAKWFVPPNKPDLGQRDPASELDSAEEDDGASSDGSEPNSSDSETEEIRVMAEQIELEDAEAPENNNEDANENDNVVADENSDAEESEENVVASS